MVTATHGYSKPQRSHQCVAGFLSGNNLTQRHIWRGWGDGKGNGPSAPSLTGREATAEAANAHPYSVRVWYFTARVDTFLCCSQFGQIMTPPLFE
ncbi:hypothetical protein EVAR_95725_1 [Eumeta japonica]|uniref:Uncharacterized protein n=1 Tax=Eumeta variegata TaxID=151549 RepID=A0A4C1UKT9_EUMVA|nr:hypothetical protein EVAR_95725_1 [Eumeta japonica]